jgi:hypothetical protein
MFFSQMGHLMPITYLPPTSHLQFYNLPTYLPKCTTFLLTHPPTYLLPSPPSHPPISYNLPIFIPHSLVVMSQNKHKKLKN